MHFQNLCIYCMFTSPRECGLCTQHIRSSTGIGLLHLAEWLCPPLPLQTFPSRYMPIYMLAHDMPFILATLSMYQQVIIFKTTFLYTNAI